MAVSFASISINTLVPGAYVEFDGSRAGGGIAVQPHEVLLVGQKLASGTAISAAMTQPNSTDEAKVLFGDRSMGAQMYAAYRAKDTTTPVHCCMVDDASGTNATGGFTFTGPATETREMVLYVAGRRIAIGVTSGMTAANIETAALAAFALTEDLPVSYAGASGTGVDVTALHDGTMGNFIFLGHSLAAGERLPAGVGVTVTAMSGGATDPSLTAVVTAMGDDQYNTIICGLTLKTELDKIIAELESRWDPPRQIEGMLFFARNDAAADHTTAGNSYNTKQAVYVEYEESGFCKLPWEAAARAGAISARRVQADPSTATSGADMGADFPAPPRGARFNWSQRNTLLTDGVSTTRAGSDGRMLLERLITTYQTNSLSLPDKAFRDEHHMRLLAALRYSFRSWMGSKMVRDGVAAKLADDGNEVADGTVFTPATGRAEALAWFLAQKDLGWVENYDQFARELIVERPSTDRDRLDFYLPPDLINALLVTAAKMSFIR